MRRLTSLAVWALGLALLATSSGCGAGGTSNSNGDTGTVLSTVTKLTNPDNNIGALNSAELQILVTELPALVEQFPQLGLQIPPGMEMPQLTDAQAEALEQFLDANNVNTFEDLADLATLVQSGQVQIPDELMSLWEEFAAQFGRPRPNL
jgi:hypothetical protein